MNHADQATAHETKIRRWTTFTPPQSAARAALCGLFLLRRSYLALEYAGCPLPDELNVQRAAAPRVVAAGAVANVPVVTPPNGEFHEVCPPAEYWVLVNPSQRV